MPTQIKVPAVGESIKSVYVADWKKNTGDYCNAGDVICEIETDKASQEIPTDVGLGGDLNQPWADCLSGHVFEPHQSHSLEPYAVRWLVQP